MKTLKKYKLGLVLRSILLFLVLGIGVLFFSNYFITAYEESEYQPLGEMVEVGGQNMHVYTKGQGENTIVLLSGLGTAAPILDFEPLVNELSKHHKVAVVELPGYGWSDQTDKKRSVENIVEEIRTALKKSNVQGPYILMPHSISGIYSVYFADNYPEEVKAIVGIDPTLPQAMEYFGETPPTMPSYFSAIAPSGIARLALTVSPGSFLPLAEDGTYSEENLKMTTAISSWRGYNTNVIDETNEIKNNINKTRDIKLPSTMPVIIFTPEIDKPTDDGKSKKTFYETQLTDSPFSKVVILRGHHYLHWTRATDITKEVEEFIKSSASVH
ncbi:alpha/beta hydrolase [Planococcus sp. N028]|uniref:Alpha/beta hydrolase n=1 Tax=Planococcus shixiaomingii TaxID=3058393 RepID=A0ABT8MY94_9BACL|nr:alpha/beta hydrolase [Planococcus sp. N028]MDN7240613.1 alpha/beta hydrolase [Planococcus sp. N028]